MAIIKCKMCGGDIELSADKTLGTCDFCGCTITFPKVTDDQRAAAFNRGNHFRRIGEFDKALAIYERIVREDDTDAEAHWCCALCRFGIEYVEDPATYEYIPTCHRVSFDSFLEDVDYLAAVEHSEGVTQRQYQKDAAKIADIQRGILATSQNEAPFDVFICYKESDEEGQRTRDSLMAQDIYYQLTEQGYRVFFARITLEEIAGRQYEPYIFAALNSAKVMVVIGTKPEYMNAVWVKNEWSRFLSMMKKDRSKLLLPCYRDMDPYDMPEQLSVLQSYDMAKIGFIQDLIRGIKKVLDADKQPEPVKEPVVVQPTAATPTAPLLRRVFLFLEDGDWESADEYCEKVLDIDPENAQAYLGKLMAELKVKNQNQLKNQPRPFDRLDPYQKVLRFGDSTLKTMLTDCTNHIKSRNQEATYQAGCAYMAKNTAEGYRQAAEAFKKILGYKDAMLLAKQCPVRIELLRKEAIYQEGLASMGKNTVAGYQAAVVQFQKIPDHKDAAMLIKECGQKAGMLHKERIYQNGCAFMNQGTVADYTQAKEEFKKIPDHKDSAALMQECDNRIARIHTAETRQKKKRTRKTVVILTSVFTLLAFGILLFAVILPNNKYDEAMALKLSGEDLAALALFDDLGNHKDSAAHAAQLRKKLAPQGVISAGKEHTVALKANGTVVTVGNKIGSLGNASGWTDIIAIGAGNDYTIGLKADGTAVATTQLDFSLFSAGADPIADWTDIVAISAGDSHALGLKADGSVVALGWDYTTGKTKVSDWSGIIAVSAGYEHSVGLKTDGTVVAVGNNDYGQCNVSGWTDIIAISAGSDHTVGLRADGSVLAVGSNYSGQCDVSGWTDIIAVSAGGIHTVGLKSDGTVVVAGNNSYGECDVYGWTNIVAISAGDSHTVGLKADGTVVAVGCNYDDQCEVTDWKNIKLPE